MAENKNTELESKLHGNAHFMYTKTFSSCTSVGPLLNFVFSFSQSYTNCTVNGQCISWYHRHCFFICPGPFIPARSHFIHSFIHSFDKILRYRGSLTHSTHVSHLNNTTNTVSQSVSQSIGLSLLKQYRKQYFDCIECIRANVFSPVSCCFQANIHTHTCYFQHGILFCMVSVVPGPFD